MCWDNYDFKKVKLTFLIKFDISNPVVKLQSTFLDSITFLKKNNNNNNPQTFLHLLYNSKQQKNDIKNNIITKSPLLFQGQKTLILKISYIFLFFRYSMSPKTLSPLIPLYKRSSNSCCLAICELYNRKIFHYTQWSAVRLYHHQMDTCICFLIAKHTLYTDNKIKQENHQKSPFFLQLILTPDQTSLVKDSSLQEVKTTSPISIVMFT